MTPREKLDAMRMRLDYFEFDRQDVRDCFRILLEVLESQYPEEGETP